MRKLSIRMLIFMTITFFTIASCSKEQFMPSSDVNISSVKMEQATNVEEDEIIYLNNPYTVTNMQLAYNKVKETSKELYNINITASHYYVKFKPKDESEMNIHF